MMIFRRVLTIFFLFVFFPLFFLCVLFFSFKLTVLSPSFVKKEFLKQDVYNKADRNLPEVIGAITAEDGKGTEKHVAGEDEISRFLREQSLNAVKRVITPDVLQEKTENVVDALGQIIFDGESDVKFSVSIEDLKAQGADDVLLLFQKRYEKLPYCSLSSQELDPFKNGCRVSGITWEQLIKKAPKDLIKKGKIDILKNVPDKIDSKELAKSSPDFKKNLEIANAIKLRSNYLLTFLYLLPGILIVIFFLLAKLFTRGWGKVLFVFGTFMSLLGVLSFAISFLALQKATPLVLARVSQSMTKLPSVRDEIITPTLKDVLDSLGFTFSVISLSVATVGTVLVLGYWIYVRIKTKKLSSKQEG